jgi:C-terminal processing protease CtpA/Prc
VILVGRATSSSAEMFAGALRVHGRATLAGIQTRGCIGEARSTDLADGSQVFVTDRKVLIGPDDLQLNGIGLTPDIATPERLGGTADDPALSAAIRLLSGR